MNWENEVVLGFMLGMLGGSTIWLINQVVIFASTF